MRFQEKAKNKYGILIEDGGEKLQDNNRLITNMNSLISENEEKMNKN